MSAARASIKYSDEKVYTAVLSIQVNIVKRQIKWSTNRSNQFIANTNKSRCNEQVWGHGPALHRVNPVILRKTDEARCHNHNTTTVDTSTTICTVIPFFKSVMPWVTYDIFTAQVHKKAFFHHCVECRLTSCGLLLCQIPLVFIVHWLLLQTGTATALRTHSTPLTLTKCWGLNMTVQSQCISAILKKEKVEEVLDPLKQVKHVCKTYTANEGKLNMDFFLTVAS